MYSREEIDAIIRCAADDQDAAIILTAALTDAALLADAFRPTTAAGVLDDADGH